MHTTHGLIPDLLESVNLFAAAVAGILEPRLIKAAAGRQIEPIHWRVLELAGRANSTPMSEAAAYLGLGTAAMRRAAGALQQAGLLRRGGSSLSLTAAGRAALGRYREARESALARMCAGVPEERIRVAAEVLGTLGASVVTALASPEDVCRDCAVYFKERCLMQEVASRHG